MYADSELLGSPLCIPIWFFYKLPRLVLSFDYHFHVVHLSKIHFAVSLSVGGGINFILDLLCVISSVVFTLLLLFKFKPYSQQYQGPLAATQGSAISRFRIHQ